MKTLHSVFLAVLITFSGVTAWSQARVQVIHNSADTAAEVVDVWLNDILLLDNFAFRTASPFVDAPAGVEFTIAIQGPESTGPENPIWSQNYTLAADETYILVAEGIVSGSGYNPATPFDIAVYGMGREEATMMGNTDVLVHHGSTDAPTIDVVEVGIGYGTIVDDISYGEFDGYLELPTTDGYLLNLFEPVNGTFATYDAPLATLGLDGAAITLIASGFLNPENNSNGEEFGLWVALASGGDLVELTLIPPTPLAYIQVIHNSADAAAAVVDVWLDDYLALDNFAFRTASITIGVPAGEEFTVSIKGPDSNNPDDPIWSMNYTLEEEKTYILVADGIVSTTGYEPAIPFNIEVYDMGRYFSNSPGNTDVLVHHGSTDAPTVDVYEIGVGAGELVNDLMYADFAGYLELNTMDYILEIRDETGMNSLAAYEAPLATLGLDGVALTVVASGFLNPANNSNGPAFGLWVALPFGGPLLELPAYEISNTARVQVIHNSADAAAEVVDVWLNDILLLDNFAFRTASPFVDAPAGEEFTIAIKGPDSMDPDNPLWSQSYTLTEGETYILVANGIVSASGYNPATPFDIYVYPGAREMATSGNNTDVMVFHGSTDAPTVDIVEVGAGAGTIVDNLAYGNFDGYLELPTADYSLDIRDESGTTTVANFAAPLSSLGLDGQSMAVLASGFLNPGNNSDGAAFGLLAVLADGTAVMLNNTSGIEDSPVEVSTFRVFPNPAVENITISFELKEKSPVVIEVVDLSGRSVRLKNLGNREAEAYIETMNVAELGTGLYFLNIRTDRAVVSKRFLVQ